MQNQIKNYKRCSICYRKWNVSINNEVDEDDYICPHCISKIRRAKRQKILKKCSKVLVKYLAISLLAIFIYMYATSQAFIERGYSAHGGEVFILLLPAWWAMAENVYRDYKKGETKNV